MLVFLFGLDHWMASHHICYVRSYKKGRLKPLHNVLPLLRQKAKVKVLLEQLSDTTLTQARVRTVETETCVVLVQSDQFLIYNLYVCDESLRSVAEKMHSNPMTVGRHRDKLFKHLASLLEKYKIK